MEMNEYKDSIKKIDEDYLLQVKVKFPQIVDLVHYFLKISSRKQLVI
jgi:hypothetical protein